MAGFLDGLFSAFKTVGKFTNDYPIVALLGMSAVAGALGNDEMDVMKEQERIRKRRDDEDRRRRNQNLQVGDIKLGKSESRDFLESTGTPTTPYSIINSRIGRTR